MSEIRCRNFYYSMRQEPSFACGELNNANILQGQRDENRKVKLVSVKFGKAANRGREHGTTVLDVNVEEIFRNSTLFPSKILGSTCVVLPH